MVYTKLEDLSGNPTLESSLIKGPESEIAFEAQLKALGGEHKALILYTSHMGGHKFAGNVIVCLTPIPSLLRTNIQRNVVPDISPPRNERVVWTSYSTRC